MKFKGKMIAVRSTSVVVAFLILAFSVFSVLNPSFLIFASGETDEYGTIADGITGNALALSPLNNLENADFEEGLKYWGSYNKKGKASANASVLQEGDNSYLEINRETADNAAKGVISVPVKISGLAVGDEVALFLDYRVKVHGANISTTAFYATIQPLDKNATAFAKNPSISAASSDVSKWTRINVKNTVTAIPENGEGIFYVNIYLQYKAAAKIDIDNIVVAIKHNSGSNVTPEGFYEKLDGTVVSEADLNPSLYGTEEDGISGNALDLRPSTVLKNADFEEGLRYWGSYTKKGLASADAAVKQEGDNSYLEINRETADNAAKGVISVPVKISGLAVGDEVALFLDYRVKVHEANISATAFYATFQPLDKNTTAFAKNPSISAASSDVSKWTRINAKNTVTAIPENGEGIFYINIYLQYKAAAKIDIDNIVVAIKHNSGSNITPKGYYCLLDGTLVSELTLNPNMYGTEEDGISGSSANLTPLETFKNGDFSEGLKYWAKNGTSGLASDVASIETNGSNKYLVIKRDKPDNAAKGVNSAPFVIKNLKKGDVVAIMFDYKTEVYGTNIAKQSFFANLCSTDKNNYGYIDGKYNLGLNSESRILENSYLTATAGWSTLAAMQIVDKVPKDGDAVFYMQIYLQYKAAAKICFDNFRVYVKHVDGANKTPDGFYETLDGTLVSEKIFTGCFVTTGSKDIASGANDYNYPGLVYSWIGTEEDGIYSEINSLCNNFPVRTNMMNTDFSKGLQYWFESKSTGYTSKKVKLKTEKNGNKYISLSEDGTRTQINQTNFWLTNVKAGDNLYVITKFRGTGNFRIQAYISNVASGENASTKFNGYSKVLYEPESDDDWGYTLSSGCITVPTDDKINPKTAEKYGNKFSYYIMVQTDNPTQLDDIKFVLKNSDGTYSDLDGNVINIPVNKNRLHYDVHDGFDWDNSLLKSGYGSVKAKNVLDFDNTSNDKTKEKDDISKLISVPVMIAVVAVIIVMAGITVILVVKKRQIIKSAQNK